MAYVHLTHSSRYRVAAIAFVRYYRDCEMRYLAVSTKLSPEIAEYPDSGKFGVLAEFTDATGEQARRFLFLGQEGEGLNYWDGE